MNGTKNTKSAQKNQIPIINTRRFYVITVVVVEKNVRLELVKETLNSSALEYKRTKLMSPGYDNYQLLFGATSCSLCRT